MAGMTTSEISDLIRLYWEDELSTFMNHQNIMWSLVVNSPQNSCCIDWITDESLEIDPDMAMDEGL